MWKAITLSILFSLPASAQPRPEVVQRFESSYTPAARVEESGAGLSLYGCFLRDLELHGADPVTGESGVTRARIYLPRWGMRESTRNLLLLPPTGGENVVDRGYANSLCAAGFRVLLLQSWTHDTAVELDLGMHDKGALRSLTAVRRALDYLAPRGPEQTGILGTSVGAITSALALGFDPRLKAGVLIVGGVGFADIIAETTEEGAARLRERRMKEMGFAGIEDYRRALKASVLVEPAEFAGYSGEKKALAFVGARDLTVPTRYQWDLVRAFGAEAEEYDGDHVSTVLHTYGFRRDRVIRFFEESLRAP